MSGREFDFSVIFVEKFEAEGEIHGLGKIASECFGFFELRVGELAVWNVGSDVKVEKVFVEHRGKTSLIIENDLDSFQLTANIILGVNDPGFVSVADKVRVNISQRGVKDINQAKTGLSSSFDTDGGGSLWHT